MNFEEYQQEAWQYAIPTAKNPSYLFGNLASEAGETLGVWAKSIRDGFEPEDFFFKLKKELGDCLWQIAGIATYYGMSIEDIAESNIAKLQQRRVRGTIQGEGNDR